MIQIDTGLLELLPEYYKDISDYQAILSAEETELEQIALFINAVHDNFFVQTMDESTAAAWERLLGITAESGQTLAFRQARVLNRISTRPPFTMEFLSERLNELIGVGKWTIDTTSAVDLRNAAGFAGGRVFEAELHAGEQELEWKMED